MTLFFVNQQGVYTKPQLLPLQKEFIRIGPAQFTMYPVSSSLQMRSGRRVIAVDFVDEFFKLNNYYVVLTGRGCGTNVFQLGSSVDTRTNAEKLADALDPEAQQIADFYPVSGHPVFL